MNFSAYLFFFCFFNSPKSHLSMLHKHMTLGVELRGLTLCEIHDIITTHQRVKCSFEQCALTIGVVSLEHQKVNPLFFSKYSTIHQRVKKENKICYTTNHHKLMNPRMRSASLPIQSFRSLKIEYNKMFLLFWRSDQFLHPNKRKSTTQ